MIEAALVAGICAEGADAVLLGVIPTPGVAHIARDRGAPGAVISASHNPFADNGVKLFAPGGRKIPEPLEGGVEHELRELAMSDPGGGPSGSKVGVASEYRGASDAYVAYLVDALEGRRLDGMRVVIDCGNGASFRSAPTALRELGADRRSAQRDAERHQHQRGMRLHVSGGAASGRARKPGRRRARLRR